MTDSHVWSKPKTVSDEVMFYKIRYMASEDDIFWPIQWRELGGEDPDIFTSEEKKSFRGIASALSRALSSSLRDMADRVEAYIFVAGPGKKAKKKDTNMIMRFTRKETPRLLAEVGAMFDMYYSGDRGQRKHARGGGTALSDLEILLPALEVATAASERRARRLAKLTRKLWLIGPACVDFVLREICEICDEERRLLADLKVAVADGTTAHKYSQEFYFRILLLRTKVERLDRSCNPEDDRCPANKVNTIGNKCVVKNGKSHKKMLLAQTGGRGDDDELDWWCPKTKPDLDLFSEILKIVDQGIDWPHYWPDSVDDDAYTAAEKATYSTYATRCSRGTIKDLRKMANELEEHLVA